MNKLQTIILLLNIILCVRKGTGVLQYLEKNSYGGYDSIDQARLQEQKDIDHGNNVKENRDLHDKNWRRNQALMNEKIVQENMLRRGGHMTPNEYINNQHKDRFIL